MAVSGPDLHAFAKCYQEMIMLYVVSVPAASLNVGSTSIVSVVPTGINPKTTSMFFNSNYLLDGFQTVTI